MQAQKLEINTLSVSAKIKDYQLLLKPNLSGLVVFSSIISYLLAPNVVINLLDYLLWQKIGYLFLGGMLVTGAANTINQILERQTDGLMNRTKDRPMPAGRMNNAEAWVLAFVAGLLGIYLLVAQFNLLSGLLSLLSLLLYAFAYTPMKRIHPVAVFIGALPGAMPPLIGWAAAKGSITPEGWVLFLFQFFWQFPHFWSIAYIAFEDYERAGIRMLPTRERDSRFTGLQCIYYSLVLIPLSFFAQNMHITGNIGMSVCLVAALLYAVASYRFYTLNTVPSARQVMFASIIYLPVIFLAMLFDKA